MPIGPFTTYAPPGVYTRTIQEPVVGQLLGGLRVPVLIGVGQEALSQTDFELVRGSSSSADTPIFGEDPSGRWVVGGPANNPILGIQNGNRATLKVRNYPIVDGEGVGRATFEVSKVSVFVNGEQTVVGQVDGPNGLITLLVPPSPTDVVSVNYYFRRKDTQVTDDVSEQVTDGSAILIAPKAETYDIVSGTNDTLEVYVDDATSFASITLTAGTRSAADIANDVNVAAISGLTASVHVDNQGLQHIQLVALSNILIGNGTANGSLGYNPGDYTNRTRAFRVFQGPIVDGSDGGITTTDTSKVVVLVNGVQIIPTSLDGANRLVTLPQAPRAGVTVTIQYWFNTSQDTFDYLPNSNVITVGNVGISPGRRDFLNGPDFIVVNDGDQSKIVWGTAWQVVAGESPAGSPPSTIPFDSTQVTGLLVDNRIYAVEADRFADPTTNALSLTKFLLPLKPTTGNGRDTPLGQTLYNSIANGRIDLPTNRPDLITVYVGKNVRDALAKPAVQVLEADVSTNLITLKDPVAGDQKVFATFWYNLINDDVYTLSVVTPGPSGVGKFTVTSQLNNGANVLQTRFGTKASLPQTVQWPSGVETVPDAIHYGGQPVSETVTVTFDSALLPATHASFTNGSSEPYDIYTASQIFGGVVVDGGPAVSVNLSTAFPAELLGQPVATTLAFLATDHLVLEVDDIILAAVDISTSTSLTAVATAINAVIDADTQVHADGSGTFLSTAPNGLASVVTYGTEEILKIEGRNVQTSTNGLQSNVRVRTPTTVGQTDGSATAGLEPNLLSEGSWDSLNQPAEVFPSKDGPYAITLGVDDTFLFSIDGADYAAALPTGSGVTVDAVVNYVNAAYVATAPAADQALALASTITLGNDIQTQYNAHIAYLTSHTNADTTNPSTSPVATDLPTLITLLNEIKGDFNAHIVLTSGPVHGAADTVNTVTASSATDLGSAIRLAYDIKAALTAHEALGTPTHLAVDAVNLVTASNLELVAITGQGFYAGLFYLRSRTNTVSSSVGISVLGTANDVLGFTSGAFATYNRPTASRLAAALNFDAGFNVLAAAWPVFVQGLGTYLRIDSLTVGSGSSLSFTSVASTAFITDTGLGIVPGTSGDLGEAAQAGYSVSSSNPNGSSGVGTPGQTYTDEQTGLRFTVLQASSGDYADNGSFTLIVDSNWTADASIPSRGIPGLETTVFNTLGMNIGMTAILSTYAPGGNEPAVGDTYFVSYQFTKTNLSTMLFRDLRKIQQNFGPPTPENPLSLAARLSLLNGAVLVGLKQVLRSEGSSQASVGSFVDAIDEQRKPIEGSVKPDVITPLGTDPQIFAALNQHCIFMSSPRQEGERIGVVGVAAGTTPTGVQAIAQALASELMVVTYPDAYVISVQDDFGNLFDQLVDGSFMAAALAGTTSNPSIDVANPWTRRQVLGFKRLGRILDPTEANQVAVAGVSVIEQADTFMRVRHGLTTRLDTVITRTPSVTLTIQYVQQAIRRVLDPYIGQKFTGTLIKSIENSLTGMFSNAIDNQIVSKVAGIAAEMDENDPTILRTSAIYVPVFPLEYIVSTLQIRIRA